MTARNLSGSIRSVEIDGVAYNVMADADAAQAVSEFENTATATSGDNMMKMVKRALTYEGIDLATNADERVALQAIASSLEDVTLAFTNAANDRYVATGRINVEANQTADNKTTVILLPRNQWQPVIGQ